MATAFAVYTSDPNLVSCELTRLDDQVRLAVPERGPGHLVAAGLGSYAQEDVLLHRFGAGDMPQHVGQLEPVHRSEVLLFHARATLPGTSLEHNTQPFRFRSWLFAMTGAVTGFPSFRTELVAALPDYLQRHIAGESDAEAAFGLFLSGLREVGRTDDRRLPAELAAEVLGKTARTLRELSAKSGAARAASLALIATNGRVMAAARSGEASLFYTVLEGSDRCDAHGLPSESTASQQLLFAHRRRRTVALATEVKAANGWVELADGQTLAVDGRQQVATGKI